MARAFKRPADLAATDLRGGGTLIKISDARALADGELDGEVIGFKNRGYVIAARKPLRRQTVFADAGWRRRRMNARLAWSSDPAARVERRPRSDRH